MRKNWIIVFTLLILCLISFPAFGNAASPYENPDSNMILFDDDTGIVLMEEWVKFTIDENRWNSRVEVVYDLENTDRDDSSLDIMFLAPYFDYRTGEVFEDSFKVVVDGVEINDFQVKESEDIPENWNASYEMEIIDPVDDRVLEKRLGLGRSMSKGGNAKGTLKRARERPWRYPMEPRLVIIPLVMWSMMSTHIYIISLQQDSGREILL